MELESIKDISDTETETDNENENNIDIDEEIYNEEAISDIKNKLKHLEYEAYEIDSIEFKNKENNKSSDSPKLHVDDLNTNNHLFGEPIYKYRDYDLQDNSTINLHMTNEDIKSYSKNICKIMSKVNIEKMIEIMKNSIEESIKESFEEAVDEAVEKTVEKAFVRINDETLDETPDETQDETPDENPDEIDKELQRIKGDFNLIQTTSTKQVMPINSIMDTLLWNKQIEKNNTLQNQSNNTRAYLFNYKLSKINKINNRIECLIGMIPNQNYYNFLKDDIDSANNITDKQINNFNECNTLHNGIVSRSSGDKYDSENIPKWNVTFTAGEMRSQHRVFYGNYKVRAKTRLSSNCVSFLTFSMFLPDKDPEFKNNNFLEEISIKFSTKSKKDITLIIKSKDNSVKSLSKTFTIDDENFSIKKYNNYKLFWEDDNIKFCVNGKVIYKSKYEDPIPQLPGYSYFTVRPDYNTNSCSLWRKIKQEEEPNIIIKSFEYKPLSYLTY
jgi:hypothetical protein